MNEIKIIGGKFKGRKIRKPKDKRVRPVAHKIREAIFAILSDIVEGSNVIDCFAGSGSYAFEAISRGAASAVMVEINTATANTVRKTIEELGLKDRMTLFRTDIRLALRRLAKDEKKFDIIFLDPPFIMHFYEMLFANPHLPKLFNDHSIAVLEHPVPQQKEILSLASEAGFSVLDIREYGQVGIAFLQRTRAESSKEGLSNSSDSIE